MKILNSVSFRLIGLGYITFKSIIASQVYKYFGIDFTYPMVVRAQLNNACNSKCNMCDVWRLEEKEIPASFWINALKQLKSLNGNCKIAFAGGEVLLKDDVFEIFEFCHHANLPYGIVTNGYLLNPENIRRLLELKPMNISISLDSLDNDTYQSIRGMPFLESVKSNIEYLMMYIQKNSLNTKVFFKTVVSNFNIKELHLIANYAMEKKIAGITFDPVKRRRKIFIEERIDKFEMMANIDMQALQEAKNKLIRLKREGWNILNSENNINQWFENIDSTKIYFCEAPLREIIINNEGQIRLCDFTESSIGNIISDNIRSISKSEDVRNEKKKLTRCKKPCVYCIHRNIYDYFKIFNSYLKN